jgi:hypothetical protein
LDNDVVAEVERLAGKAIDLYAVMAEIADTYYNKKFSTWYPICPKCQSLLKHCVDNTKRFEKQLDCASWKSFKAKTIEEKSAILFSLLNT